LAPEENRICKRCSVRRVDALVNAYLKAHGDGGEKWISRLRKVDRLCKERGYDQAAKLLLPGLGEKDLRALCWNVSSFLKDPEVESIFNLKLA
jgi:hypothetical protein